VSFSTQDEEKIVARDQGKCVRCGRHVAHLQRGWAWSIHHRRPRGSGGTSLAWVDQAANGIILCGSGTTGCHGWVEKNRRAAIDAGYLISALGLSVAEDIPLHPELLGFVYLTNDGGWIPVEEGPTPESMRWAA
jgi:hypothetical protein